MKSTIQWLFAVSILFLAGCSSTGRNLPTPTPLPPVVNQEKIVFPVERGPIISQRVITGEVMPSRQDQLFFRDTGYVTRVGVKTGDAFKKGDILAEMQVDDLLDQLQQARLDLEVSRQDLASEKLRQAYEIQKAEADVAIAQSRLELAEKRSGGSSDEADSNLKIAQEQLKVAQAWLDVVRAENASSLEPLVQRNELSVERLERLVADRQVIAPYDGIVLGSYLSVGNQTSAFDPVFLVGDPAELVIAIGYDYELSQTLNPESVAYVVRPGSEESDDRNFPAKFIPEFLPLSQPKKGVSSTDEGDLSLNYYYFALPENLPAEELPVGQAIKLRVILGEKQDALLLHPAAIRGNDQFKFVIVLDGDQHRRVEVVEIGLKSGLAWEIKADLKEGDQVLGP
jgi:multidrug efflux pump subunit AcrA (membrane-fusion protein)